MVAARIPDRIFDNVSGRVAAEIGLCTAAGLSLAAALMHVWAMPEHFAEWWGYGAFFLIVALAQGLFGVVALRGASRPLLLAGIAGNLAMVSFYVVTRTAGIPFFGPHAGEVHPVGTLDLLCVGAEVALVAVLVALAGLSSPARNYTIAAIAQALGAGLVLHLLYLGTHGSSGFFSHWLTGSVLWVPLSLFALLISTPLSRRFVAFFYGDDAGFRARVAWALSGAFVFAGASVAANTFAVSGTMAVRDAGLVLIGAFAVLLAVALVRGTTDEEPRKVDFWRPRAITAVAGLAMGISVLAGPAVLEAFDSPVEAQAAGGQCNAASYDRSYDVAAINVDVPYNRWGNEDPHGQAFVLQGDKAAMKNWFAPLGATPAEDPAGADNRRLRPRPLVIRANAGECVKVDLTNELDMVGGDGLPNNPRVGMKVYGPAYEAQTSDGSAVGYNADTTVGRGETISHYWKAPNAEGTFLFRDQGAMSGSEADTGSTSHGLYGAFVVEPRGSTWRDPETGQPLYAGATNHNRISKESGDPYIDADIIVPGEPAFRETVQVSQDELPGGSGFSFNYGAEPSFNRIATNPAGTGNAEQFAPDSIGEETSLSSWTYGDPSLIKLASGKGPWLPKPDPNGPGRISDEDCGLEQQPGGSCYVSNVTHAYEGDPTKIRFVHSGVKETHVFHMHAHQWRAEPNDKKSTTIDSQTYGPGESFTAELIGGAGSKPGTIGDSIFHCHLYPHFADGFWALFRTHDVLEDGTNKTPDGVNVRSLKRLPDRASLPAADLNFDGVGTDNPGYPRFIPGKFGWRAPQAPGGISEASGLPDLANTVEREDLTAADRIVAGRPLDATLNPTDPMEKELADKLAVEKQVLAQAAARGAGEPGAPFTDPCPTGSREVTYNVSVIQTDVTYNEAGWHDKQARMLVLNSDLNPDGTLKKDAEPLFIRVNAGDCVNFNLTNRLPNFFGNDEFMQLVQTNMAGEHIHLVKFDVLASDGASNGWNYQQAAFTKEQADFNKNRDLLTNNVNNCDWKECRIQKPASWDPATAGAPVGQTISERWFADYELRTVFTHDHHFPAVDQNRGLFGALIVEPKGMDFRNPETGRFFQPINNAGNGQVCGTRCNATAAGAAMDVIGPGTGDDFREFGLAFQDFVSLHKSDADGGAPVNAPTEPESFPDADPGVMAINYRNAPHSLRQTDKNGNPADPAHVFSSTVHGDPSTPILEAYSEDPVRIRLVQGSQEEQHVFTMNGVRWRQEPDDPESPLVNAQALGVSDAFNFEVPKITCGTGDKTCAGDYLYSSAATDDLYLGMWGLFRARGKEVPSLLPLPDNASPTEATVPGTPTTTVPANEGASLTGGAPPEANAPGTPCPTGVPVKKYEVVAMQANLEYNEEGDHDPHGLIYALAQDVAAIKAGDKKPEPLVLRANKGDCIEVGLTNRLTSKWLDGHGNAGTDGDPTLPSEPIEGTRSGLRVSLHPQLVKYDARGSDGAAIGYNRDQTVAPGERKLYRWYADTELGTTNLTDFGDVRGHRHHGLFAGLNIEPRGATYRDPATGEQIKSGVSADIRVPGPGNDFREFTTFFQDGLNLRDATGAPIEDPLDHPPTPEEPAGEPMDAEDMGEKGFNYASSPFKHRIGDVPETGMDGRAQADVFSSRVHGDPDTPIFRAFQGDDIRMRVLQGSDKPRQHSFQLSGASWKAQPGDPGSSTIGTQGGISVGRTFNMHLSGFGGPGDYRYGCGLGFHHLSGGLWGIVRVYPGVGPIAALDPSPLRPVDDPLARGNHPIMPLEISQRASDMTLSANPKVLLFGKSTTLSGRLTAGGSPVENRPVILEQRPVGAASFRQAGNAENTDDAGRFSFTSVKPQRNTDYRVRFEGQSGAGIKSSSATLRVGVRAQVTNNTATSAMKVGRARVISGVVLPAQTGSVKVTVKRGTKVVLTKTVRLEGSRYRLNYRPNGVGNYSVVAAFAGDDSHLSGRSPVKSFRATR